MKNILKIAQAICYEKNEFEIEIFEEDIYVSLEDVADALKYIEFKDKKIERLIFNYIKEKGYEVSFDKKEWKEDFSNKELPYGEDVKEFLSFLNKYGITEESIITEFYESKIEFFKVAKKLQKELPKIILGQEFVIEKIVDSFKNKLDLAPDKPLMIYTFLGAPGTGKTFLAKNLAKFLPEYKIKIFDMSHYVRSDSALTLRGTDNRYSNASPGELTSFVRENPKSIIVFDEFEKAHNSVQNELLTILEGAYLVDKCGWFEDEDGNINPLSEAFKDKYNPSLHKKIDKVDFSKTIIIFTSNAGKELYKSDKFWELVKDNYKKAENMIIFHLSKETKIEEGKEVPIITPPILSRIAKGEILFFKELEIDLLYNIAKRELSKYIDKITEKYGIEINIENIDKLAILLTLTYSPHFSIRRIVSKIGIDFFDLITDYLLEQDINLSEIQKVNISYDEKTDKFLDNIKNKTKKYFFRKNLTLNFNSEFKLNKNELFVKISDVKLERIYNMSDFENGLVFEIPDVDFEQIYGHKKVKERLKEIVKLIKNKKELEKFKIKLPKGMLLYGPPGTGKTMLAKALAKEADLPFLQVNGSDLLDLKKIKNIFSIARDYAPSIIFIDEIDALGNRYSNDGSEVFINELLTQIDGFNDSEDDVFVIAATNYKERIDPALLRSGRIDLHMYVPHLDKEARKKFIENILSSFEKEGDFDIDRLVLHTTGMNGADLAKLKRETALYLIRNGIQKLNEKIFLEQINIIKYGEKIEREKVKDILESTAIHEAGHAVILKTLFPNKEIEQITVTARSNALGFVSFNNEENFKNLTKEDIFNHICVALAGRKAQIKKYGKNGIDTGASNDLQQAFDFAYKAIAFYGMDEEIGPINIVNLNKNIDFIEQINFNVNISELNDKILQKTVEWLKEADKKTKKLVDENWDKIEKCANMLIENEVIYNDDIEKIMES
jgi:cell division protease FtsH